MRKGGTEVTVTYPNPTSHPFTHKGRVFIVCHSCAQPTSGPRESQVDELVWASASPESDRTKLLKELTDQ